MPSETFDYLEAIDQHSEGFASAADGNLAATVEHCPGWSVADLVWHLAEVHWFWSTIVEERLSAPPEESRRPTRVGDDELIKRFRSGAHHLIEVLERAPDDASVWTWAPAQQDVAFVARHQVQEAAVHHWDAAHATGERVEFEAPLAIDAIDEFLTFSVANDDDPVEPSPAALKEGFAIATTDDGTSWTVVDGTRPGALAVSTGRSGDIPTVSASASDLLLWLYRRIDLDVPSTLVPVVERFRAFTFTD